MDERDELILAAVDLLAPSVEAAGLDELELSVGELQVRLARIVAPAPAAAAPSPAPASAPPNEPAQPIPAPSRDGLTPFGEPAPGHRFVGAPLTGVWYDAPSPGARPYVTQGSEVAAGQVVGLIEAMKLFNEIKADASGTITRILVDSGTLVKRKQPLLEIDPR
jgi:acetyl-CoA carboxylase biotin carboxyl carrier protein